MACETCLPFLSNNSLAKLLPPLKFWSLEVRKETCAKEGQTTAAVLSWGKGSVCREARAEQCYYGWWPLLGRSPRCSATALHTWLLQGLAPDSAGPRRADLFILTKNLAQTDGRRPLAVAQKWGSRLPKKASC